VTNINIFIINKFGKDVRFHDLKNLYPQENRYPPVHRKAILSRF
jgi:hypothetical protein